MTGFLQFLHRPEGKLSSKIFHLSKYYALFSRYLPKRERVFLFHHKKPDIRIENVALNVWYARLTSAEAAPNAAIQTSEDATHHVLVSRALLVWARLRQGREFVSVSEVDMRKTALQHHENMEQIDSSNSGCRCLSVQGNFIYSLVIWRKFCRCECAKQRSFTTDPNCYLNTNPWFISHQGPMCFIDSE